MRGTARRVIVTTVELENDDEVLEVVQMLQTIKNSAGGGKAHTQDIHTAQSMLEAMDEATRQADELRTLV